ncbi:MAG: response regulator [Prevotellaceae bacterium]|nr:response regulator [Prevotellaceae bacterium]
MKHPVIHLIIYISLLCLPPFTAHAAPGGKADAVPAFMFKQLSTAEGLSNGSVRAILRDSRGFLWIGTESGLNKYDGYTFRQYHRNNSNLSDDDISDIFEGPEGNIWIHTSMGYSIYDYQTGTFDNDYKAALDKLQIPGKNILHVGKTARNEFWAYDTSLLYLRNLDNNTSKTFPLSVEKLSNLAIGTRYIYVMYADGTLCSIDKHTAETVEMSLPAVYKTLLAGHDPHVYTGQGGSLWVYTSQNSLLLYQSAPAAGWENITLEGSEGLPYNCIQHILDTGDGHVWILTSHIGLYIYNIRGKSLVHLMHNPLKPHTLASNNLSAIYRDKEGTVYVGNRKHGLCYFSPASQTFLGNQSPVHNDILAFSRGTNPSYIYYGTDGSGLIRRSLLTGEDEPIATPANIVLDLATDNRNRLWIGTYQKGLLCYDQGRVKQYTTATSPLLEDNVYSVKADNRGYLWIGTMKGYIQRLDPETEQFETILYRPGEFFIQDMFYDGGHCLYVASIGGLVIIDTNTRAYTIYDETSRFRESKMLTVYKDSRGLLWMGHPHGLSIWDEQTDSIHFIDQKSGLAANYVKTIMEDGNHRMWIGTGNGLSRIQLDGSRVSSIVNYSVSDGLLCNDANIHAVLKLDNGNILMGTPKGCQTIVPQEMPSGGYGASIYLTGIDLKSGTWHPDILGGKSLECAQVLSIPERENSFTLSFSALDLVEKDKIKYAYQVNQSPADWISADNNKINLSMLPAGSYTLTVKACDSQGVWSPNIKTLRIKILPPWWRAWWAWTLYALIAAGAVWLVARNRQAQRRQRQLMQTIEQENQRQQHLNALKLQFFANISHELRTPLSLIKGPLEAFFTEHPEHRKGLLEMVKKNADYLLELINQLLDYRKLDAKSEVLHCRRDNVVMLLAELFHTFDQTARKRGIAYRLTLPHHAVFMDFDYDKLRKICLNILSNAFKFTPDKGNITLSVAESDTHLELTFSDTGCGIADASKEKIFQRFYQADKNPAGIGGSGIGLHIVSEYVKMYHGTVSVADNHPTGSVFTIRLPLHQTGTAACQPSGGEGTMPSTAPAEADTRPTVLLVDDNPDFLKFLSGSLSKQYHVVRATNGREAMDILEKRGVNLVISDVMMPVMDGLELCATIKHDAHLAHIPVILLTAKAGEEYLLDGLHGGADDYITKPFNMEVLQLRAAKLIEAGACRQPLPGEEVKLEPGRVAITPLDRQLVDKAIQIVEENIGNNEFSVEELAGNLHLSRSYFYKKMVKITGKKPIEFIRTIRMQRARQLLAESQMQVSEIAYTLGYNFPKVFSKHFKEEFHVSPSEYMRRHALQNGTEKEGVSIHTTLNTPHDETD